MPRATYGPRVCYTTVVKIVKTIHKTTARTTKHARPATTRRPPPLPPRKSSGCPVASQLHDGAGGASACTPAVDVPVGDTGETTDDGNASPILCMRGGLTGGRTGRADAEAAADADADASNAAANAANAKAANAANAKASNAANSATNDADDAAGAGAVPHDVFDSQGRRFHGPALEGTNILRLVDLAWFREECDDTLRARLGHHDRDAFDLVSKYVLALKARYFRVRCLFVAWNAMHVSSVFPSFNLTARLLYPLAYTCSYLLIIRVRSCR